MKQMLMKHTNYLINLSILTLICSCGGGGGGGSMSDSGSGYGSQIMAVVMDQARPIVLLP